MTRADYARDATLKGRVFDLLETAFPGIESCARRITLDGGRWEQVSTPFLKLDQAGSVVAHVGVLSLPVVIAGIPSRIFGVHAVCTHPSHRRRGYMNELMHEAMHWAGDTTVMLFTSQPRLYERFGFRVVAEHWFQCDPPKQGAAAGFRPLDARSGEDRRLLVKLLDRRDPVSDVFAIQGAERGVFAFNCPDVGLWYAPDLDAVAWMEMQGRVLRIYDIVAERMPRLDEIAGRWHLPADRVEVHFSPDRLGCRGRAVLYSNEDYLMVRGALEVGDQAFMVPRTGRC